MAINNTINTASKVTKFTSSGTWTKDPRTQSITLLACSGGCGAGSGRRGNTSASGGGCGGSSGSGMFYALLPAFAFDTSETVTIGSGGTGGAAVSTNTTNGNAGTVGTSTSIGNVVCVAQTTASPGGTSTTASVTANGNAYIPIRSASGIIATNYNGATGNSTGAGTAGTSNTGPIYTPTAGGGGGGALNNGAVYAGGAGGGISLGGTIIITGSSGGTNGGAGTVGSDGITLNGVITWGTGGGGGSGYTTATALVGNGADGGTPGGGGGGGGGVLNSLGLSSGSGGNGQRGELWIIEFF